MGTGKLFIAFYGPFAGGKKSYRFNLTRVATSAHGKQEAYGNYENTNYNHPNRNRNRLTKLVH
jgi:hypothetical protein